MPFDIKQSTSPYYYLQFFEMINFAIRIHGDNFNENEQKFLEDFQNLGLHAQRLYIRMFNRTKPIFHLDDLLYEEIGTYEALEELKDFGFLRTLHKDDYQALLAGFTKPKLVEIAQAYPRMDIKASRKKTDIVDFLFQALSFDDFVLHLPDLNYYVPLRANHIFRFKEWWKPRFDIGYNFADHHYDANQIFVVVDVETTGTRTPFGRITEIGAVKIQNGQIIGEWSSLINPDAYIPPFITDITGISNDMVKDAPFFYEIANEFISFMRDAVFVAHNVNFDYGFISSELKRLGKTLQKTKLCTVAAMREYYPGHGSYSLANLCKEYTIPLTHHHRALCDAYAAAQLLLMIEDKRKEKVGI